MATTYNSISATTNSLTTALQGRNSVSIKNDGTADVYFVLFNSLEEPRAATSADALLKSSDGALIFTSPNGWKAVSVITGAGTATVRTWGL